jgi:hypothetical protein
MAQDDWTVLLTVRREETATIIAGLLDAAGIEHEVIDRSTSEFPVPEVDTLSRFEIWVPEEKADEARRLLNEAREGTMPCASCGHMSSANEAACEYCGSAM